MTEGGTDCPFLERVQSKCDEHIAAFSAGDAQTLVDRFFTSDALWECSGFPCRTGRAQLMELFEQVVGTSDVEFILKDWRVSGGRGWTFVDYPVRPYARDQQGWTFRCLFNWVLGDDDWLVDSCVGFTIGEVPPVDPSTATLPLRVADDQMPTRAPKHERHCHSLGEI